MFVFAEYDESSRYTKRTEIAPTLLNVNSLTLVFTSVSVGVIIRSVERYDLVKIKPTESEAEH